MATWGARLYVAGVPSRDERPRAAQPSGTIPQTLCSIRGRTERESKMTNTQHRGGSGNFAANRERAQQQLAARAARRVAAISRTTRHARHSPVRKVGRSAAGTSRTIPRAHRGPDAKADRSAVGTSSMTRPAPPAQAGRRRRKRIPPTREWKEPTRTRSKEDYVLRIGY